MHNSKLSVPDIPGGRPFSIPAIFAGFLTIAAFSSGLAAWSLHAPIEGAVVSPGVVSVASYRKTIQHLEGGIVDEIMVKEGDPVKQGELLIRLSNVRSAAEANQLKDQHLEAMAVVARLQAEHDASG